MIRILLNGARGRMGRTIAAVAEDAGVAIAAETDQGDDPGKHIADVDVVVDFSFFEATADLAALAVEAGKPMVIGTTGHPPDLRARIIDQVAPIPVIWAGNYSVGVNLLNHLAQLAATALPEEYHPEVVEMHHRHKRDAPSGTADRLVEIIRQARHWDRESERHGRQGIVGERPDREIGVHALRGGDVVGDHTVYFATAGERVELTHRATDRAIFARGALRAAQWLCGRDPGLYEMADVLGLRQPR